MAAREANGRDRVLAVEQTLRRAMVARHGVDVGTDAAAEAIAWALEHPERVADIDNLAGYLYRVGQTAAGRYRRWWQRSVSLSETSTDQRAVDDQVFDLDLFRAIEGLRHEQRVAVVMVHCWAYSCREVAAVLGTSESAVTNHVHRGLQRLRAELGGAR